MSQFASTSARARSVMARACSGELRISIAFGANSRIVSQGAKLAILARETLGANGGRDHGDSAGECFQ